MTEKTGSPDVPEDSPKFPEKNEGDTPSTPDAPEGEALPSGSAGAPTKPPLDDAVGAGGLTSKKAALDSWRGAYVPMEEREGGVAGGSFKINDKTRPQSGSTSASSFSNALNADLFAFPKIEQPPIFLRELTAVALMAILCDLTIYRGHGFAGLALLFALAPVLLWLGAPVRKLGVGCWIVGAMSLLLAGKLLWAGSPLLVAGGFILLVAFAMSLTGRAPYLIDTAIYATQTVPAGFDGAAHYVRSMRMFGIPLNRGPMLAFTLPLAALLAFSTLFLLANPDLRAAFGEGIERFFSMLNEWIVNFWPHFWEVVFWLAAALLTIGLLRPLVQEALLKEGSAIPDSDAEASGAADSATLYAPLRNTLIAVVALFAVYLIFEFKTLWLRVIPEGFYYAGYAHEGAAWLTTALALATVVLSVIFKGHVLRDERLPMLRKLAWIWSFENILLSVSVYNRLCIYISYNGLSRMRMIGFFGITTVVVGFLIVVWKIMHHRDFVWLLHRHLWALALASYLFALTPIDSLVTGYNTRRIRGGDPAPSVQISVHPIGPEGILRLLPLLECDDEIIRDGVHALLQHHLEEYQNLLREREDLGWTTRQLADERVWKGLREALAKARLISARQQPDALQRFYEYAQQWY